MRYNRVVSDDAKLGRALGAVVGSAVGDALGAPFEFGPPGRYLERFPEPVLEGIGEMIGGGSFDWEPGEFTDDTQMALVQAESLLACGGVDGADLFERFRLWASEATDVGVQTSTVLRSGLAWDEASGAYFAQHPRNSAGNGSLMRSTPSAVFFAGGSAEETVTAARAASAVTHADPAAGWGAALHHVMIRAALDGRDPLASLPAALDLLPDDQSRYREMLRPDWRPSDAHLPNGTVWCCLAQAVWAVRHNDTFADAVIACIELGGDTDTVAAVAGGLAGAIHGIDAIPERWTAGLHGHVTTASGRVTYRLDDLYDLTRRLADRAGF
jgi:ADP-ribosyl-[dinitrogen reductase] hydrolase